MPKWTSAKRIRIQMHLQIHVMSKKKKTKKHHNLQLKMCEIYYIKESLHGNVQNLSL